MTFARTIVFCGALASCYGTPRSSFPDASSSAGTGGVGGQAGTGGGSGTGPGPAGVGGSGSTGGTAPVFVGGPCIVSPDRISSAEVIARASDTHLYRRAFDGRNWGTWTVLEALNGALIDARSDLDCSATFDTIHIVATGLDPAGVLEHSFGFGTNYNPFVQELGPRLFAQSPSVSGLTNTTRYVASAGFGYSAELFYFEGASSAVELTPITLQVDSLVSAPDISQQGNSLYFAAFDSGGKLAIYHHSMSSGGATWIDSILLEAPGIFAFSPSICAESGASGSSTVNVAAVSGQTLWFAGTGSSPQFSTWSMISQGAASSPDCVVLRENPSLDPIIHIVTLSSRGTVTDHVGNGTSWVTTDLGTPP